MAEQTVPGLNPASGAASALQEILTQQRLEKRQALLDSLHQKEVESQIRDRDENAAANAESRQATAEWRKQQAAISKQNENDKFLHSLKAGSQLRDPGLISRVKGINPDLLSQTGGETLPSTQIGGASVPQGAPSPPTPSITKSPSVPDPTIPQTTTYMGTDEQQDHLQQQMLLRSISNDPKSRPEAREWSRMRLALPKGENPPPMPAFSEKEDNPIYGWSRDGMPYNTGITAPKGAVFRNEPPPPTPVPLPSMTPFDATDEEGNTVRTNYNPKDGSYTRAKLPDGLTAGNRIGGPNRGSGAIKPLKLSPGLDARWTKAVQMLAQTPGDPNWEPVLNAEAPNVARELGFNEPHITEPVLAALRDWKNRMRKPTFFEPDDKTPLNASDQAKAQSLWTALTGGFHQIPQ